MDTMDNKVHICSLETDLLITAAAYKNFLIIFFIIFHLYLYEILTEFH